MKIAGWQEIMECPAIGHSLAEVLGMTFVGFVLGVVAAIFGCYKFSTYVQTQGVDNSMMAAIPNLFNILGGLVNDAPKMSKQNMGKRINRACRQMGNEFKPK
jgi:divalent metal cation (Fe/Co/Zn/Cd) transporter